MPQGVDTAFGVATDSPCLILRREALVSCQNNVRTCAVPCTVTVDTSERTAAVSQLLEALQMTHEARNQKCQIEQCIHDLLLSNITCVQCMALCLAGQKA